LLDIKRRFAICRIGTPDVFDGRERVDPGPGHDDLCNSAAIALALADNKRGPLVITDEMLARASIRRIRAGPGAIISIRARSIWNCSTGDERINE
jgi:hypothetical protein